MSFRNERKLYKRRCDATGKEIVSIYSPDKSYKVYHQEYWWSDTWDPMSYGKDFDFSRWTFEQMGELMREVPTESLFGFWNTTSEYTNYLGNSRNCFMTVAWVGNEDLLYCYWVTECEDSVDSSLIKNSSGLYECFDCENCFNCVGCTDCKDCNYCYFSENLRGKSYYLHNMPSTKWEIDAYMKKNREKILPQYTQEKIEYSENSTGKRVKI
jgi:hypothetical protein